MLADIWSFVVAVTRHWLVLAGGAAVIVAASAYESVSKNDLPGWLYAALFIGFFFVATFLAWNDERATAEAHLTDRPQFHATIEQIHFCSIDGSLDGKSYEPKTFCVPQLRITNTGAPSILGGFQLEISAPNGTTYAGIKVAPPQTLPAADLMGQPIPFGEPIEEKTMAPVARGALVRGRLMFMVTGATPAEIQGPAFKYTVVCRDAWDVLHRCEYIYQKPDDGLLRVFPGMGVRSPLVPPDKPTRG